MKTQNRQFDTGANRDTLENKLEYSGFLSPGVLEIYAKYMHKHRYLADGSFRASDNWKKGMPPEVYLDSLVRHVMAVWLCEKNEGKSIEDLQDALCGVLFNAMGLLYERYVVRDTASASPRFPSESHPPWGEFIHPDDIDPNVTGQGVRVDPNVLEQILKKGDGGYEAHNYIRDARYFRNISDDWFRDEEG